MALLNRRRRVLMMKIRSPENYFDAAKDPVGGIAEEFIFFHRARRSPPVSNFSIQLRASSLCTMESRK